MNNTTLPGTGESVRTIDKGGNKTQVLAVDVGGAGEEKLLNADNRMPVAIDEMIYLLSSILEKMPRVDAADRLLVSHAESNPAVTVSSGTVTTVGVVSNQTNIGGRDASHATFALANMSALHIYDNIRVTA